MGVFPAWRFGEELTNSHVKKNHVTKQSMSNPQTWIDIFLQQYAVTNSGGVGDSALVVKMQVVV
jgi:hypothetical protein